MIGSPIVTLLIGIVLFIIFVGRHYIKDFLHAPKGSFDGIGDREMIDKAIGVLNGRFGSPFKSYVLSEDIAQILKREPDSEYALNIFLQSVAAHCGFDRHQLMLRLYGEEKNLPPGRIQKLGSSYLMELHMDYENNTAAVLSVIVHEFCHFFLSESGIELVNTLQNEVLTDTAAVYFGFYEIMREGYKPNLRSVKDGMNQWHRVGYLNVDNIDYVHRMI